MKKEGKKRREKLIKEGCEGGRRGREGEVTIKNVINER